MVDAVLDDPSSAPITGELKAALALIETFTLRPDELGPSDIEAARSAGLKDDAIEHALLIATLFNLIDRLADALDFFVPEQEQFDREARILMRFGYRFRQRRHRPLLHRLCHPSKPGRPSGQMATSPIGSRLQA